MNLKTVKTFVVGLAVGAALMVSTTALAKNVEIKALLADMNFIVNGQKATMSEQALTYNGKSYLPVKSVSNMLGYDVAYDGKTKTVKMTSGKVNPPTTTDNSNNASTGKGAGAVVGLATNYLNDDGKIDLELVKSGIEGNKINVNSTDSVTGETLLMVATQQNSYFVFQYLVGKGANLNLQDKQGKTALHHAVIHNSTSVGYELLSGANKAKTQIKDNDGKLPIDYAKKNSSFYIALFGEEDE